MPMGVKPVILKKTSVAGPALRLGPSAGCMVLLAFALVNFIAEP